MPDSIALPDGWTVVDEPGAPYVKFVKRDAVTVPKRRREDGGFTRDIVVLATSELAGVTKGPGARQSWHVDNPEEVAARLADVLEDWVREGGDPYGGSDLNDRLDAAVTEAGA